MDEEKIIEKAKNAGSKIDDFVEEQAAKIDAETEGKTKSYSKVIVWAVIALAIAGALQYFGVIKF